jgi:hypothetical protein
MSDHISHRLDRFVFYDPMRSGQQFQTKGRLKSFDQFRNLIETAAGLCMMFQKSLGILGVAC